MKLSIIVPAFKVEEYIEKCILSLMDQGIPTNDFEIIIINDGSPDNSKAIALDFQKQYSNIIFIDQENQGVSVARNKGLNIAQGEYIAFVDPDDTIHPNSILPIIARADQDKLDILYLSLEIFDEQGNFLSIADKNGDDAIVQDGFHHPRRTYLSTLYRRGIIGDIRFKEGISRGQDTVFTVMVQSKSQRISYCSLPYYKYLQRESSSRQFLGTEKTFLSCLLAIKTIKEFKETNFPNPTALINDYFDKAMLVFIQRTLEWNIIVQRDKARFNTLKSNLKENNLDYLIDATAVNFKMFNKNFMLFSSYLLAKKTFYDCLRELSKQKRKAQSILKK